METELIKVLEFIKINYIKLKKLFNGKKDWTQMSDQEIWIELCFCILSSNVPYELADSATYVLWKNGYLNINFLVNENNAFKILSTELSKPIFEPLTKSKKKRKYRFYNKRAKDIINAAKEIYEKKNNLKDLIKEFFALDDLRDYLIKKIPGIGLKESAHFLRNISFSNSIPIIDTHIVKFLKIINKDLRIINFSTKKKYKIFEQEFKKFAVKYNYRIDVLDYTIWTIFRQSGKIEA